MVRRVLLAAAVASLGLAAFGAPRAKPKPKPKVPPRTAAARAAKPAQHNQFVTVDEFIRARRAPGTAVSIEGYIVLAYPTRDGGLRLSVTDSIDRVLSAEDAQKVAQAAATVVVPRTGLKSHPRWAWTAKGIQRQVMYTGPGRAQKELHDIAPKMRLTGFTAAGRAVINPATQIEAADDNGEWKAL